MSWEPVALSAGTGNMIVSGTGSNIVTKDDNNNGWAYSDDSFTINDYIVYKINGVTKFTSTTINSGTVYVSIRSSAGAMESGNGYKVTYWEEDNILRIELIEPDPAEYAVRLLGINSSQGDPGGAATSTIWIDNADYDAIKDSGVTVQSLTGTAVNGDQLDFHLGSGSPTPGSSTVTIPPPVAMVRF